MTRFDRSSADRSIERDVKLIAGSGGVLFVTLVTALLLVQGNLGSAQSELTDVVVPTQRELGELSGAVARMFLRQSEIAAAGVDALPGLADREAYEQALRASEIALQGLLATPALCEAAGFPRAAVDGLDAGVVAFLAADAELYQAVSARRALERRFVDGVTQVDTRLRALTEASGALAGILRLDFIVSLRGIADDLAKGAPDPERVRRVVLGDIRAALDAIDVLDDAVRDLAALAGKVGMAANLDALNALRANELSLNRAQIERALAEIEGLVAATPVADRVRVLRRLAEDASQRVGDEALPESLAAMRRTTLEDEVQMRAIRGRAAIAALHLAEATTTLRLFSEEVARRAQVSSGDVIASSRLVSIVVVLIGLLVCVLAALSLRKSIWGLRAQNTRLRELSADLAESNRSLEQRVAERTERLTSANNELAREMEVRTRVEVELRQAQKLESVGRLAAGIAHEINTPVQFIGDSATFARGAFDDVLQVVRTYRDLLGGVMKRHADELSAGERARTAEDNADLEYLEDKVPEALDRVLDGVTRVATIVRAMKEFSHPGSDNKVEVDLNHAITNTLVIAANEYKYVAEVVTELAPLPRVPCHVAELNQVILNLVVNAAHAIEDVVQGSGQKGRITVRTMLEDAWVRIEVSDTGAGIPESIRERIFDPFFTTKEVGRGSGQGLAIARSVVVDKHGGSLTFETRPGQGTTFVVKLPLSMVGGSAERPPLAA